MRIFLTGASGLLGSAFAQAAHRRGHLVLGISGQFDTAIPGVTETRRIDLRDPAAVERAVFEAFPDAIVNCAAISLASDCARDPAESRALNVELPAQLALLARHLFATLIHISSEQVFDGAAAPYSRDATPCPLSEYGRQKLESELRVHEVAAEFATTLRLPLLNGNSPNGRRSLHELMFRAWERGETTKLFTDEIRQPCLADNAAEAMVELCERSDLKGVFHWGGESPLSRWEMGQAVITHFGLPPTLIEPAERGDDPRFAERPPNLAWDLAPLAGKLKTRPMSFADQLDRLIVPKPARAWYNAF